MSVHVSMHNTPTETFERLAQAFGVGKSRDGATIWVKVELSGDESVTFFPAPDNWQERGE